MGASCLVTRRVGFHLDQELGKSNQNEQSNVLYRTKEGCVFSFITEDEHDGSREPRGIQQVYIMAEIMHS